MEVRVAPPLMLALVLVGMPQLSAAQEWNWRLTPYFWLVDVTLDAEVNDQQLLNADVSFSDLLDDADAAFMLHFEGQRDRIGVFGDLFFADLGDEPRIFDLGPGIGPGPIPVQAKADPELIILDLGGAYYPGGEDGAFSVNYGVRVVDIDDTIDILLVGGLPTERRIVDLSETFYDALVGVRYKTPLNDKWSFAAWADVSTGDTEMSYSAAAVFGYSFGSQDQYAIRFGYRHWEVEVEADDVQAQVETELSLSGPLVGFTFHF